MKKNGLKAKNKTNLRKFVQFIMTNYTVMWFRLKQKGSIGEAPRHLYGQIKLTEHLSLEVQRIARKNHSRNAYWAHPECLLLSMLTDSDEQVRTTAVEKILSVRGDQEYGENSTRKLVIP